MYQKGLTSHMNEMHGLLFACFTISTQFMQKDTSSRVARCPTGRLFPSRRSAGLACVLIYLHGLYPGGGDGDMSVLK